MKTDKNNRQHDEILAKYLSGEMSEAESRAFEEEISVSEENKINIEKMKKQWTAMEGYKNPKSPDTRKAWNKLHDRLRDDETDPGTEINTRKSQCLFL